MDPRIDPDQAALRATARDFLSRESPGSRVRELASEPDGFDRRVWEAMATLGWQSWAWPPELGGGGGRFLDLVVLEEEMGRAALPSPFHASVVLAGFTILAAGAAAQQARHLPAIASGRAILTLAVDEAGAPLEGDLVACRATRDGRGWRVEGTKTLTPFAHVADAIVCLARTAGEARDPDGLTLLVVDRGAPGLTIRHTPTLAGDPRFEVRLEGVTVGDDSVLGEAGRAGEPFRKAREFATLCLAAEMLGGSEAVLEMTLAHARTRHQGGRPIGRHQALQHRIADVAIALDAARVLLHDAAWRLDRGLPATLEVSMAKAWLSDSYREATWVAALMLGGTGFMAEHDLGLHYRRAKAAELTLGDAATHREIVARALLDEPIGIHQER